MLILGPDLTTEARRKPARIRHASFDPQAMNPWLDRAHLLLTYAAPPSGDSVLSSPDPAISGTRQQSPGGLPPPQEGKWDKHISLVFLNPAGTHPWSIETTLEEAARSSSPVEPRVKSSDRTYTDANPLAEGPVR